MTSCGYLVKLQVCPMCKGVRIFIKLGSVTTLAATLTVPIQALYLSGEYELTLRDYGIASLLEFHLC